MSVLVQMSAPDKPPEKDKEHPTSDEALHLSEVDRGLGVAWDGREHPVYVSPGW